MCLMCDGYSEQEVVDLHVADIEREGWTAVLVEDGWTYSIGLRWSFEHPEIIVTHPDLFKGYDAIRHAVDDIRAGRRFSTGTRSTTPCGGALRFAAVHHANLATDWFGWWPRVARACGEAATSLRAVQAVVEACDCVQCRSQVLLDRRLRPGGGGVRGALGE